MNYPSAASGLKTMFLAQILTIVGGVIAILGGILAAVTLGLLSVVVVLASLLVIAAGILEIWGLYKAGADDEGYRGALIFAVISVVLGVVVNLITKDGSILRSLASLVQTVLNFLVVNAVCQTTSNLLHSMGKDYLAERGNTVSRLYLICTVITVVCTLVGAIPIINVLAGLAGIVGGIITIVGYVLYLGFLNSGSKELAY